jgi:hypothetical protein
VYNIWNTTAGGNSVFAVPGYTQGTYWPSQPAKNVFDGNLSTEYCNYGVCNDTTGAMACGKETGFYLTMNSGPNILAAFYMGTCPESWGRSRDPMLITIEGSNLNGSALLEEKLGERCRYFLILQSHSQAIVYLLLQNKVLTFAQTILKCSSFLTDISNIYYIL